MARITRRKFLAGILGLGAAAVLPKAAGETETVASGYVQIGEPCADIDYTITTNAKLGEYTYIWPEHCHGGVDYSLGGNVLKWNSVYTPSYSHTHDLAWAPYHAPNAPRWE